MKIIANSLFKGLVGNMSFVLKVALVIIQIFIFRMGRLRSSEAWRDGTA